MADYGNRTARFDDPLISGGRAPVGATPDPIQPDGSNLMRGFGSPTVYQQPPGATRIGDVGQFPGTPAPTTDATPAATTGSPGSPLNTLYGVSNDSFLTDDQRKLARQIQGKFDASLDQRDRELQRYSAPRLSSFAEDEALARAIAEARGLNYRAPVDAFGNPTGAGRAAGGGGGGGNGGLPRIPGASALRDPTAPRPTAPQSSAAKWQSILSGLSSIAPLLFGKDAYGNFLNKGVAGWLKDQYNELFPGNGTNMSDAQLDMLLNSQGANGSWDVLPDPVSSAGDFWGAGANGPDPGFSTPDFYGPDSGWGNDIWSAADPWAGWTPDSGGDIIDLFGGV
jgi:hypothetical protein